MNSITQDIIFKQSVVEYSLKHGITEAAKRYKQHRKTIYRWREKYDGSRKSLANKSRRPHSHPKQHTREELIMIKKYKAQNKDAELVVLWVKLRRNGYTRSITSLYRVMQRLGIYNKAPSKKKKYIPKAYQQMTYPGERVQIDVKYVPRSEELKKKGERYYQYTAIDEYTRQRVLWASKEHSTYASTEFLKVVMRTYKYKPINKQYKLVKTTCTIQNFMLNYNHSQKKASLYIRILQILAITNLEPKKIRFCACMNFAYVSRAGAKIIDNTSFWIFKLVLFFYFPDYFLTWFYMDTKSFIKFAVSDLSSEKRFY